MKLHFTILLLILAVISASAHAQDNPIKSPPIDSDNSEPAIKAAIERGVQSATNDIKSGKLRILYYGKPWSVGKPLIDDDTRLPVQILAGCTVTSAFTAEVNSYNSTMRKWTQQKNSKTEQDAVANP